LVNAVLRKVAKEPIAWPNRSIELSHPEWLLERWDRQYGCELATRIAQADLLAPQIYIRVPPGASLPPAVLESTGIAGCHRLVEGEPGVYRIQDIGSQSIVPLLGLLPGQSFLDLCAAPGNKTAQALETPVSAVACDIHLRRLVTLKSLEIPLVALDAAGPLPFRRRFDRILVDAPCSGTGTLARNPEIKWRLRPDDLRRLHEVQKSLLRQAHAALAQGGRLVYATCSLEADENQEVVATLPALRVIEIMQRLPGRDPGDGFFAAVIESG
jgi:16S rRNA (cytosine967-C5)-methyltransferase